MSLTYRLLLGDCREQLRALPAESIQCAVTSPPYWGLRDYGVAGQIGLEKTPEAFVAQLVEVFREVRRVLRPDGVLWLNLGDCYATGAGKVGDHPGGGAQGEHWRGGHEGKHGKVGPASQPNRMPIEGLKPKDLVGIPWRSAFALQADGWWLRSDIIWHKPNPMPESVTDRPTKAHEYVFLLSKSRDYFYDAAAVAEPITSSPEKAADRREGSSAFRGQEALRPRARSGNKTRTYGEGRDRPGSHLGAGIPWEDTNGTRNRRSVWNIATKPFSGAHFATFPEELPRLCVLAGSRPGDTVLDPFNGAATTGVVSLKNGRHYVGCELNSAYIEISRKRLAAVDPLLTSEAV